MEPADRGAPRAAGPVREVLLIGLAAGFLLTTVGLVLALCGVPMECTCPLPCESVRCIVGGGCCGLIALGLLILMITPPAATLAVSLGFLRIGSKAWATLCLMVVLASVAGLLLRLK